MSKVFNPAPYDKYATDPEEARRLDQRTSSELKAGLVGTFPASDPVSITIPSPAREPRTSPISRMLSIFR